MKLLNKFTFWFKRNFICATIFSKGHIPEPYLHETYFAIHTKRCSRCHSILGLGTWKHIPPPPNSTPEEIEYFEEYRKNKLDDIRKSINN